VLLDPCSRIVRDYKTWVGTGGEQEACAVCLSQLLEGRAAYLGRPDPTWWKAGDVRAVLLDLAVTRLTDLCNLVEHGVPTIRAFVVFLGGSGRLHPGSVAITTLLREVDRCAQPYRPAMGDRSRFRMAKTFYTAMRSDGVDLEDDDAVDTWMEAFNAGPAARRVAVLEHLLPGQPELARADFIARDGKVAALAPGQARPDSRILLPPGERQPDVMPVFKPVALPSRAEAVATASGSILMQQVLQVARWIGQGRKVTKNGLPTPADVRHLTSLLGLDLGPMGGTKVSQLHHVPALEELFWMALQVELIQVRTDGLVAGPRLSEWDIGRGIGDADGSSASPGPSADDVWSLWDDLFTLVERGRSVPEHGRATGGALSQRLASWIETCLPEIMVTLYRWAGGEGVERDVVTLTSVLVENEHGPAPDPAEPGQAAIHATLAAVICGQLARLVEHGVLELHGPGVAAIDTSPIGGATGHHSHAVLMAVTPEVFVRLTPLGRWAMTDVLVQEGALAPQQEPAARAEIL
jgi:hypothetical protein